MHETVDGGLSCHAGQAVDGGLRRGEGGKRVEKRREREGERGTRREDIVTSWVRQEGKGGGGGEKDDVIVCGGDVVGASNTWSGRRGCVHSGEVARVHLLFLYIVYICSSRVFRPFFLFILFYFFFVPLRIMTS